jgi:hypothetical protein
MSQIYQDTPLLKSFSAENLLEKDSIQVKTIDSSNYTKYHNKLFNSNISLIINLEDNFVYPFITYWRYPNVIPGTLVINSPNSPDDNKTFDIPSQKNTRNITQIVIFKPNNIKVDPKKIESISPSFYTIKSEYMPKPQPYVINLPKKFIPNDLSELSENKSIKLDIIDNSNYKTYYNEWFNLNSSLIINLNDNFEFPFITYWYYSGSKPSSLIVNYKTKIKKFTIDVDKDKDNKDSKFNDRKLYQIVISKFDTVDVSINLSYKNFKDVKPSEYNINDIDSTKIETFNNKIESYTNSNTNTNINIFEFFNNSSCLNWYISCIIVILFLNNLNYIRNRD